MNWEGFGPPSLGEAMTAEEVRAIAQAIAEANAHPAPAEWADKVQQAFEVPGSLSEAPPSE